MSIEEIKKRRAAITPGEWKRDDHRSICAPSAGIIISHEDTYNPCCGHDLEFIAHAPTDIDYLLAEIERRDEELKGLWEAPTAHSEILPKGTMAKLEKKIKRLELQLAETEADLHTEQESIEEDIARNERKDRVIEATKVALDWIFEEWCEKPGELISVCVGHKCPDCAVEKAIAELKGEPK
jgi:hypothetical protein